MSQPDNTNDPDIMTLIKNYLKVKYNKPGNVFLGLVHRLDRMTGGVMVFAKTSKAASRLSAQLKDKKLKKHYLCVVNGKPQLAENQLITYLKKDEKSNTVKIAPKLEEGAKEAILEYKIVETKDKFTLLEVDLITGRSHQIRVQMSNNKTPLFGDQKYNKTAKVGEQIALFAKKIEFEHPVSKEKLTFELELPDRYPFKLFK